MPWLHMCTHLYTPEHLHSFCNKDIAGQNKIKKKECSWNVKDKQTKQQQKKTTKKDKLNNYKGVNKTSWCHMKLDTSNLSEWR